MPSEENEQEERHPYETIEERADELGLDGDERDDYIEGRMKKAGYKKGTGAWVAISDDDDDDDEKDDDDEPMTRGDWRKMQRERRQNTRSFTPPRKKGSGEKAGGEREERGNKKRDPWW